MVRREKNDGGTAVIERLGNADEIAARVEREMTFPGEIKVSVLREVRAEASAR